MPGKRDPESLQSAADALRERNEHHARVGIAMARLRGGGWFEKTINRTESVIALLLLVSILGYFVFAYGR